MESDFRDTLPQMDEKSFDETVARLKKANAAIAKLDPAIRAEAFSLLSPYVKGGPPPAGPGGDGDGNGEDGDASEQPRDRDDLITKHGTTTPVDNVLVAAAAWFMEYGSSPFAVKDIRDILDAGGLTGPVRVDRTLDTTTKGKGKALFRKQGKGKWAPSVAGEAYFRETFGVAKGRKKPDVEES